MKIEYDVDKVPSRKPGRKISKVIESLNEYLASGKDIAVIRFDDDEKATKHYRNIKTLVWQHKMPVKVIKRELEIYLTRK